MKKSLSAIVIYAVTILELFINSKLNFVFGKTYDSKYMFLRILSLIIFSIAIGFLLGIVSSERAKNIKEKIINFVVIVIPSIIFMSSYFLYISHIWSYITPQFIKEDKGILIIVGGLVLGAAIRPLIKKK